MNAFMPISNPNADKKFKKKWATIDGFDKRRHCQIIPDIDNSHYNVIYLINDNKSENFITKVLHYDSLTKASDRFHHQKDKQPMNQRIHCEPSWGVQ